MPEETTEQPKSFTLPPPVGVEALRTQMGGVPGVSDFAAQAKEIKTAKQAEEAGAAALQRQAQLGQEIGLAKQAQALNKARADRAIAQQERERAYSIEDEFAQKEKSLQAKFEPTKDTVETMAALFSVVGVLGMAMGGQGKDASTRALTAMNGMLEGWRKGRADLVKQQEKEFDKEMQRMKFELDKAVRKADRSMRLLATDRKEAEALAAEANAELGSSIGKQILEEQGVTAWYNYVTGSIQKSRQHAEDLASRERQHRETLAAKAGAGGALPKDKETQNQHRSRFEVIKNIEEIEGLLKDPQFRKLINPTTQVTPELLQRLQKGYPELANKLARVQAIEFQIGGKALTQAEQRILEPIYGWRGKTAAALEAQLAETKRGMQATQDYVESDFPGLKSRSQAYEKIYRSGGDVRSLPEPETEKPVYAVGDIISKGGKRLKVSALIKNERGDIIDYDVEEVK